MLEPLPVLLDELGRASDDTGDEPGVPARAIQISDMIVGRIAHLIRVGTRAELTTAARILSEGILDKRLDALKERLADAHEQVMGAAAVLGAALGQLNDEAAEAS
jgi:hypothetical protein